MTPRELDAVLAGETFRAEQAARLALMAGWTAAALHRQKTIPKLTKFLGVGAAPAKPPTAAQQAAVLQALHAQFGGKLTIGDAPVMPAQKARH